jgi:hypothetical protein
MKNENSCYRSKRRKSEEPHKTGFSSLGPQLLQRGDPAGRFEIRNTIFLSF